jgi:hypothetical protein
MATAPMDFTRLGVIVTFGPTKQLATIGCASRDSRSGAGLPHLNERREERHHGKLSSVGRLKTSRSPKTRTFRG